MILFVHMSLFLTEWSEWSARDKKSRSEIAGTACYTCGWNSDIFYMQLKFIISLYKSLFRKADIEKLLERFDLLYFYAYSYLRKVSIRWSVQN